ncbi:hypothetical protein C0992_009267, partial [Termitomyces sp. T32_za158]
MSSSPPSVPSRAPTPPSPGNENVAAWSAYEDRQQEYEHRRNARHVWELAHAQVLRASQMVAPGTGPRLVATVPLAPGQILVVPPSERVAMGDAPPDAVDRALRRPRGPPTREWCQANSPARCVAREQGWDLAWVWAQMGEKTEVRMGEPQQAGPGGSPSAPVVLVGPHADKGKRKAAPSSGPVRRVRRRASPVRPVAEAGPSGPHVLLPVSGHPIPALEAMRTWLEEAQAEAARWRLEAEELRRERVRGYALAQEREEELGRVMRERDEAGRARDLLLRERDEFRERRGVQDDEVERLRVQLARAAGLGEGVGPAVITAAEIDALAQGLQEAHELEGRRREWLLREVAGARDDAL